MSYTYNQAWPIEPGGPTLCLSGGRNPVINTSDAIQTLSDTATMAMFLLVQVISSSLIILYDPSHSAVRLIPQSPPILERHIQLPDFIRDPSPATFMLACLAYAFSAAAFYRLRPNDQYQHRFLLLAICSATFLSFPRVHDMRSRLPPMITAALLLSLLTHSAFPSLRAEAEEEVERSDLKAQYTSESRETTGEI